MKRRSKNSGYKPCGNRRKPFGFANRKQLFNNYRYQNPKRGVIFNLNEEEFYSLTSGSCFYCGSKPLQVISGPNTNGEYRYNGIDRLDNQKGYEFGNCVPCCKKCNQAKGVMGLAEFIDFIGHCYRHLVLIDGENA